MGAESLRQASLFGLLGLLISVAPMVMGIVFAVKPTERRLAVMRPLTLAAIFAAVSGLLLSLANAVQSLTNVPSDTEPLAFAGVVLSEALVLPFISFAFLTVAWLAVAMGMRKDPSV
jgi:hypothetical protein